VTQLSAWLTEALAHHKAGRLAEAERVYANILRLDPRNADVLQFMGLIALSRDDVAGAIKRIGDALAINPRAGVYHFNLGLALRRKGDVAGAIESYRRALKHAPGLAEAHNNLGNGLRESGQLAEAVDSLRRAIALRANYAEAHLNLSTALYALGRFDEAEAAARQAATLAPALPDAHHHLGDVLQRRGLLEDALASYRRSLELRPDHVATLLNLGNVLQVLGRMPEAVAAFERVLAQVPTSVEVHNNLGNACLAQGQRAEAIEWYRKALALNPDFPLALNNIGVALQQDGRLDEAVASYRHALAVQRDADACNNLGLLLPVFGGYTEAGALFRQAVELRQDFSTAYRNLLGIMLYDPGLSEEARWSTAREFEARYAAAANARPVPAYTNAREGERRLRVGYVSSDFSEHPVGRNLEPILAHRDRERFEVIVYAEVSRPDGMTVRFRGLADEWRSTVGLTDEQVAEQVRADGVDVLVLLAGRFDRNRPLVAALRAAPVQVSFHDPGTSGLEAMEYLIGDRVLVPRRPEERFTERVIRLPSFYIHAPIEQAPAVSALPAVNRGYVTFGSFNNPAKVNDRVLALWGEVLRAVPGSRLKLKCKNWFDTASLRQRFLDRLGVAADRVEFDLTDRSIGDHLALYADIDIALDPFPFTGSTTTFEALWMGVPVVTLLGAAMVGRWTASMLHALKLNELIAQDMTEYVRIASSLAEDIGRLSVLRAGLRERVAGSPLTNGRLRARQMERVYRALWRRWCRRQ
jgi:protein O-GlcNAc transferase